MAARQTNKRTSGKKTTTRRKNYKSKSGSKGMFLGLGLIALLIGLISISILTISGSKGSKEPEQIVKIIPAEKPEEKKQDEKKVVAVPKKEEQKQKEEKRKEEKRKEEKKKEEKKKEEQKVVKKEEKQEKKESKKEEVVEENISDLIRLVLYDHEISRSSVKETIKKNSQGKEVLNFDITCDENMQKGVTSAISSLLRKKGYTVKQSGKEIVAFSKKDEYNITLKSPIKEVVKKEEVKKVEPKKEEEKKQVAETKKVQPNYPPLPSPAKKQVKFAILLDDGGNSIELAKEFAAIKYPVGIAILPHLEHTKQTAQIAKEAGKVVFLHFPMAPKSYPNTDPGKGAVLPNMPQLIINGIVKENFENIGVQVDGFNNHMGSGITEDAVKMQQILLASKQYTNRFVDSRTTAATQAFIECKKAGYRCGENRLFIDNDNSVEAILAKIYEAAEKSRDEGSIIAIGHIRPNTLQALKIALPELEKRNYKLVSVTSLTN